MTDVSSSSENIKILQYVSLYSNSKSLRKFIQERPTFNHPQQSKLGIKDS